MPGIAVRKPLLEAVCANWSTVQALVGWLTNTLHLPEAILFTDDVEPLSQIELLGGIGLEHRQS